MARVPAARDILTLVMSRVPAARARLMLVMARVPAARAPLALVAALVPAAAAAASLTVLTPTSRREVTTVTRGGAELVAVEQVVVGFGMTVTGDSRGTAATLVVGDHEVGLYDGKSLASVDGDLKLLSAPARREEGRWLVPVDALVRLVGPLTGEPVEWRPGPRVLVIGRVGVPRVAVKAVESGDRARVVFEASDAVTFRVEHGEGVVHVSVSEDLLDVELPGQPLEGGIVESVRFVAAERLFVVRLGPRFRKARASEQDAPPRLFLDLDGEPAATATGVARPRPTPRPTPPLAAGPVLRTVVIDPGHGGVNVGALGPSGTLEKDVALAIARRLRAELTNTLGVQVFLTRDRDEDVDLDERTAIANNYKADIFISIHANAFRARGARGSEVYFLSYQASDDEARRIAQLEGAAEPLGGVADPGSDLALILWDMAQAEHLEESSALATRLQDELSAAMGTEGRGVKQAPFRVLVGATMPAVLVEAAFISNPEEEKQLASEAYQAKIASALARGIARYRQDREARLPGRAAAGRP